MKIFAIFLTLSVFFTACNDHQASLEEKPIEISQPLADNGLMNGTVTIEYDFSELNSRIEETDKIASNRSSCPAYTHALNEYMSIILSGCNTDYCAYLALWWAMDMHIAAVDCGLSGWCSPCPELSYSAQIDYYERFTEMHPSYITSLWNKYFSHLGNCSANC